MASKKGAFKEIQKDVEAKKKSPAMAFISDPEALEAEKAKKTKTSRMNIMLYPETREKLEKIAYVRRTSANNLLNEIIEEYAAEHKTELAKYDKFFSE